MTIEDLIKLTKNKLQSLMGHRDQAFARGDAETVNNIDIQILTTEETLNQLLTLIV